MQFEWNGEQGRPYGDDEPRSTEVHASEPERGHILFHLALPLEDVGAWLPDHGRDGPLDWRVMRQGDNGRRFEVERFSSRCEAEAYALTLEQRGHKQLYWATRCDEP